MATHSSVLALENFNDRGAWRATVHGIHRARILEWVAISFSRGLPDPGIEPRSPALQADSLHSEPPGKPTFPVWLLPKQMNRKSCLNNFTMAHVTVGFQAPLALQLVMMFFEAG